MADEWSLDQPVQDEAELLRRRLGSLDSRQIAIWQQMSGARRLELVGQAYRLALQTVRLTEQRLHPDLSPEELNWRVIRRMHGDPTLGRVVGAKANERN